VATHTLDGAFGGATGCRTGGDVE